MVYPVPPAQFSALLHGYRRLMPRDVRPSAGDHPRTQVRTVALICDPEAAPAEISAHLHRVLPTLMGQVCGGSATFDVYLHRERLPIGPQGDHQSLIEHAGRMKQRRGWDAAVCVTDLPLRGHRNQPLVADLSIEKSVAVLSLPAFGATRLRRRVTEVMVEILKAHSGGPHLGFDRPAHSVVDRP